MVRRLAITLVIVSLWAHSARAEVPSIDTPVTDVVGVMTRPDIERLDRELVRVRVATGAQIAVLVVRTTAGVPIEDYALQVAERWGGGSGKRSDGVLLVLAVDDRQSRLDVGYDLEDRLTDGRARQILDAMRPPLRQANYVQALLGAVRSIGEALTGLEPAVVYVEPAAAPNPEPASGSESMGSGGIIMTLVIIALFIVVLVVIIKSAGGSSGGGSSSSGGGGRIALDVGLAVCYAVASSSGSSSGWSSGSSGSSWGGGGGSGGSSSGGSSPGWGGGGGSFGGGGASSSW